MNEKKQKEHLKYTSISPSARVLLLKKGFTDIPFAKEAAAFIPDPDHSIPDTGKRDFGFWASVAHFEARYRSIDQLLSDIPVKNILELSSGFSFRGLAAVEEKNIHYIDTDLPEIIGKKMEFIHAFQKRGINSKGKLETLPLNALDEDQFIETVDHFEDGEIVIVNEGLLVYLDTKEKEKLCSIIHKILTQRGGYWITADIYIRHKAAHATLKQDAKFHEFLERHKTEEKKFESIEAAEAFFKEQGFVIDKEGVPDYTSLSSFGSMIKNAQPEQLNELRKAGKIHATWRLKPDNSQQSTANSRQSAVDS